MAGKKRGKSIFHIINGWLHLWLGLISGIIVFIVSITGCIGIAGKTIAFLISLIAASLPITGFIVWWGKRKKPNLP